MLAVRRGGAVGALHDWLQGIEQSWAFAAVHDPAWGIEHSVAEFMCQRAQSQQLTEFFADGRHAHHRGVWCVGVILADAENVVAILVMHLAISADLEREVDAVDLQALDLAQRVEGNRINATPDQLAEIPLILTCS